MKILKYIPILLIYTLILAGCNEQKKKNHWEDVSLNELMPKGRPSYSGKPIAGLSFFIFELDSGKFSEVRAAMNGESQLPITFANENDFVANGIICGGGGMESWGKIVKYLNDANAIIAKRVTLFMDEKVIEKIAIAEFPQGASINYQTANATAAMGLPDGAFIFDLRIKSLIGLKQVCKLEVSPVYKTLRKKVEDRKLLPWQYAFDATNLSAHIRPGQFLFIAPQLDSVEDSTQAFPSLGKIIFTNSKNSKRIKFCLIVCGLIKD